MRRGGAAVVGQVARLVLLACTLLGLAAMHTIGHGAASHGAASHGAAGHGADRPDAVGHLAMDTADVVGAMTQTTSIVSDLLAGSDGCAGDGCTHAASTPSGDGGMGGWELCVAVLSAFGIAVLLAALLTAAVTGRLRRPAGRECGAAAPRGPPVRPFGLTLATVSVLRT